MFFPSQINSGFINQSLLKKNTRKRDFICYSASIPGPGPGQSYPPKSGVKIVAMEAFKAVVTHPVTVASTSTYVGSIAGTVIPRFHTILIKDGPMPAAMYVFGAVFQGNFESGTPLEKGAINLTRSTQKLLPRSERKKVLQEFEYIYGPEITKELKSKLGLRGAGSVDPNWLELYTRLYFISLFLIFIGLYIPTFLQILNKQMENSPELQKEIHSFYLYYFTPVGYIINKENYLLTCSMITDDCYQLNVE